MFCSFPSSPRKNFLSLPISCTPSTHFSTTILSLYHLNHTHSLLQNTPAFIQSICSSLSSLVSSKSPAVEGIGASIPGVEAANFNGPRFFPPPLSQIIASLRLEHGINDETVSLQQPFNLLSWHQLTCANPVFHIPSIEAN